MTNGHRCVSLEEQLGHRTSDDLAATNHTSIHPSHLDTEIVKQLNDPCGRAGYKYRPAHRQLARVYRMKTIDVLCGIDRLDDLRFINRRGQRKLSQDPI